jgi:hypothetical protein
MPEERQTDRVHRPVQGTGELIGLMSVVVQRDIDTCNHSALMSEIGARA